MNAKKIRPNCCNSNGRHVKKIVQCHFNMTERKSQVEVKKEPASCKNCRKGKRCPDRSREYPCREWRKYEKI